MELCRFKGSEAIMADYNDAIEAAEILFKNAVNIVDTSYGA